MKWIDISSRIIIIMPHDHKVLWHHIKYQNKKLTSKRYKKSNNECLKNCPNICFELTY